MENISVTGEFGRKPVLSFDGTPSDELVVDLLAIASVEDLDDELVGGGAVEGEGGLAAEFAGDRDVFHRVFLRVGEATCQSRRMK